MAGIKYDEVEKYLEPEEDDAALGRYFATVEMERGIKIPRGRE